MKWWSNKSMEERDEFFCEVASWVLFTGMCVLLGLCLGSCRTVKREACGITKEYADSLSRDTSSEHRTIYGGFGMAEDVVLEDVTVEWYDASQQVSEPTGTGIVKRVTVGRVVANREVHQADSVVEEHTSASATEIHNDKKQETHDKEVQKTRSGAGAMWFGIAVAVVVIIAIRFLPTDK